jgi:DnaD/phage-associated family protein
MMANELHRTFDIPYTQIDNRIFESEVFQRPVDKLLYMSMIKFSFGKSSVFPSLPTLQKYCCCNSKQTIIDSMNRLINMKLVVKEYRISEKGNHQSNIYHLFDIGVVQKMDHPSPKSRPRVVQKMDPNNKNLEEQEMNNKNTDDGISKVIKFYENNFGLISSFVGEQIASWSNDVEPDALIYAMEISLERNKRSFGYVKSILKDWFNKKVRTLEQAQAYETERTDQLGKKRANVSNIRSYHGRPAAKSYEESLKEVAAAKAVWN